MLAVNKLLLTNTFVQSRTQLCANRLNVDMMTVRENIESGV